MYYGRHFKYVDGNVRQDVSGALTQSDVMLPVTKNRMVLILAFSRTKI